MILTLYHGSTHRVEHPLVALGRQNLDFGQGFYLTTYREQAVQWALRQQVLRRSEVAWLNEYRLDLDKVNAEEKHAEELADKVENLGIDLIIASTLIRAQQTAEAVSRRIGVPVITDPRIVEQNYGIYEGKDRKDPGFLENKRHFAYRYPGGGESMMDVAYRIFGFLNDLKEKYPDATVSGISPNLSDLEDVRKAFRGVVEIYGRIDILVNNAGVSERTAFTDYTEETFDKVMGLEMGADDYISKPFEMKEVIARIRAVLRRSLCEEEDGANSKILKYDRISINIEAYEVLVDGKKVEMPPKELELLHYLASSPNRVFTRNQLLDDVWGFEYFGDSRTVDVHVKRLREKVDGVSDKWSIKTVWGVGYKFEAEA